MVQEPKQKAKARKPKFTDKAQSERFIEAARTLGVDETSGFDETFRNIMRHKDKPTAKSPQ
jgi:hypothetical protein